MGAMQTFRKSPHTPENQWLRTYLINQRKALGLSQRALANRLDVIFSTIGKIETGDRRLDVLEFIDYCEALELNPAQVVEDYRTYKNENSDSD